MIRDKPYAQKRLTLVAGEMLLAQEAQARMRLVWPRGFREQPFFALPAVPDKKETTSLQNHLAPYQSILENAKILTRRAAFCTPLRRLLFCGLQLRSCEAVYSYLYWRFVIGLQVASSSDHGSRRHFSLPNHRLWSPKSPFDWFGRVPFVRSLYNQAPGPFASSFFIINTPPSFPCI